MVSIRTLSPVAGFHRPPGAENANATWASKSAAAVKQRENDALDKIIGDAMTAPEPFDVDENCVCAGMAHAQCRHSVATCPNCGPQPHVNGYCTSCADPDAWRSA